MVARDSIRSKNVINSDCRRIDQSLRVKGVVTKQNGRIENIRVCCDGSRGEEGRRVKNGSSRGVFGKRHRRDGSRGSEALATDFEEMSAKLG